MLPESLPSLEKARLTAEERKREREKGGEEKIVVGLNISSLMGFRIFMAYYYYYLLQFA